MEIQRGERQKGTKKFDARLRPWYITAERRKRPSWSEIFQDFFSHELIIDAIRPVYTDSGKIKGVVGAAFWLEAISNIPK